MRLRALVLAAALVGIPARAFADGTIFLGTNTTPDSRTAKGVGIGFGLLLIGFEFEYSSTSEDEQVLAPSLKTGMGNILLQTPFEIFRMQPYFTTGGGFYRERVEPVDHQETNVGINTGGGVKITLAGPLRVRVDYRVFKLVGDALYSTPRRFYVGLNLKF
jgi:hypothetical protein